MPRHEEAGAVGREHRRIGEGGAHLEGVGMIGERSRERAGGQRHLRDVWRVVAQMVEARDRGADQVGYIGAIVAHDHASRLPRDVDTPANGAAFEIHRAHAMGPCRRDECGAFVGGDGDAPGVRRKRDPLRNGEAALAVADERKQQAGIANRDEDAIVEGEHLPRASLELDA
jgi:hypothetical protein